MTFILFLFLSPLCFGFWVSRPFTMVSEKYRPHRVRSYHAFGPGYHRPVQLEQTISIQKNGRKAEQGSREFLGRYLVPPTNFLGSHLKPHSQPFGSLAIQMAMLSFR